MTELLFMDAEELKDTALFQEALFLVGADRQRKISALQKEENKRLSLAAGLLLRHAFLSQNQLDLYPKIEISEKGKPYLPQNEFYFSLSHSGTLAICAVSDTPVGCDIEKIRKDIPRITTKIFSPEETCFFQTLQNSAQKQYFFLLWTCKESVVKWMGKGISYPLHEFTVMEQQREKTSLTMQGKTLYLKSYQIENYAVSLCTETKDFPREMKRMTSDILVKK